MARMIIILSGVMLMMTAQAFAAEVHEHQLDNGLKVLLKENHSAPVITVNVVYRVGSKYERPGLTGISHLLEHMMFKSTTNFPAGEFDRRLKAVGADNNAFTWVDQTVYFDTIAAEHLEVVLELEADRMRNLLLSPEEHQYEMTVVRNELAQRDDSPPTLLYQELVATAFKAHPYKVPTIGWPDDVEQITVEELREYYDHYYQPDNAFLVVAGDFNPTQMLELLTKYFGPIPTGNVKLPRLTREPEQHGERRFTIRRAGQVDFLMLAWHVPESEHPDAYALEVLDEILGGGRTSRLYRNLVDKNLCANVNVSNSAFRYADPYLFIVHCAISPGVVPTTVEQALYQELDQIAREGVSADELARAKKQARVSFIYDKDSAENEALALVAFELLSSWRHLDDYLPGIDAVTSEDVARVAATYLTENNRTVGTYYAQKPSETLPPYELGTSETVPPAPPQYRGSAAYHVSSSFASTTSDGQQASGQSDNTPYATVHELSNGLTIAIRENHHNPTVSISGLVCAGKIDDPPELRGAANFVVQMLASGTTKHSKLELAAILEDAGIELSYAVSREFFTFAGRSLVEDFELMLEVLADELINPAFQQDEIEKTRQQIRASLLHSENDTFDVSFNHAREQLYGNTHPFSGRVEGTRESVEKITRDDLVAWHTAHVGPRGAILAIVGDVQTEQVLQKVRHHLLRWRGGNEEHEMLLKRGGEFKSASRGRVTVSLEEKSSAAITWLGPGVSRADEKWLAHQLAAFIFGGDFYSRINERLRIKDGLTYGAFATYANGLAVGPLCISAQVSPANTELAIEATLEELDRFCTQGATAEELKLAQSYLTGNFPVSLATSSAQAATLAEVLYLDYGIDYIKNYPQLINEIKLAQVNAVAHQQMEAGRMVLVVAGSI